MENFKILGQAVSNGTTEVELYSVPVTSSSSSGSSVTFTRSFDPPVQTLVTSIIVCNTAGSGHQDFSLMLYDSSAGEDGSSTATKNYLIRNISVLHQETKVLSLGLTLSARTNSTTPATVTKGDVLKFVLAANPGADVAVTAMGVEIT